MDSSSTRPSWLCDIEALSTEVAETVVGVALCITNRDVPLVHAGLLYNEPGEPPRLAHLAFHATVRDDMLPDAHYKYYWARLDIDEERAVSIAGFCRRIARRPPHIKYGIVYEGGRILEDGTVELSGRGVGLTCATFVLAVLNGAGFDLLDLGTWPTRKDDEVWHKHIVSMLIGFHCKYPELLTRDHIIAVAQERGCARFRPEEVAAACSLPWPVSFATAEPEGMIARAFLLRAL